jgi:hypothetical protein
MQCMKRQAVKYCDYAASKVVFIVWARVWQNDVTTKFINLSFTRRQEPKNELAKPQTQRILTAVFPSPSAKELVLCVSSKNCVKKKLCGHFGESFRPRIDTYSHLSPVSSRTSVTLHQGYIASHQWHRASVHLSSMSPVTEATLL